MRLTTHQDEYLGLPNDHPQALLTLNFSSHAAYVDEELLEILEQLWVNGYDTVFSCQEDNPPWGYILFVEVHDHDEIRAFLHLRGWIAGVVENVWCENFTWQAGRFPGHVERTRVQVRQ